MMNIKSADYRNRESDIYDKIRKISNEYDRLSKEGKDTTEVNQRFEVAIEELKLFRRENP